MWLLICAIPVLWLFYKYWSLVQPIKRVNLMFPGPPTMPFVGNALSFFGDSKFVYSESLKQGALYRRSFRVWLGPFAFVILQRPEDVEALLNNTQHIRKAMIYDPIIPWVQRGLLTSYGEKWRNNRKLLTPAFHFKILDGFLDIFHRNCQTMCAILDKKVGSNGFNTFDVVKLCALDNIAETAMGIKIHAQANPQSEYVKAVKTMCTIVFVRTMRPWLRPDFIFNLTALGVQQKKCLNTLHGYTREIIDKRIEERKINPPSAEEDDTVGLRKKKAFLDLLLDLYDDGKITKNEIQEEVDTFMFEGHDTITSAISFALYNISKEPDVQERIIQEQSEIFGSDDRQATTNDLSEMKYLEMVIKESLRLCPSVPAFGRVVETDLKLDEYTTIPAGVEGIIITTVLHQHPDYWPNPRKFDPERFTIENTAKRHPYAYVPFSAGPRNCIGMRFAMMEMKTTLSNVLRKFKLKPISPNHELELATEVVLQSKNGAPIRIERR